MYKRQISDGFFKTSSVGALAISNSNPDIIYAGMGEACIRSDVSYGDGVYKSMDGGNTWVHLGLEDTKHISRIRIHPNNPDLVYVAALGHAFGSNNDRGVFCSKNGGKTWDRILFKSDKEQLSRVFFNLIKNSIESIHQKAEKTSNFDKKISVEITSNNDHILINIIDNGIGFENFKENIKEILHPYFTTKKNGTGLGLSIVNKIINDHNGKIDFVPLNDGAKVKIKFILNDS